MVTDVHAHVDMLAAMEGAVLPDEEDLGTSSTAEQPQSSRRAALSHSGAGQHNTALAASAQQLPVRGASEQAAEQPQSSDLAIQSYSEAGQRTTSTQQPGLPSAPRQEVEMHDSMQGRQIEAAFGTLPPAPVTSPDLLVRPFQTMLSAPERDACMVRPLGVPHRLHMHQADPKYV